MPDPSLLTYKGESLHTVARKLAERDKVCSDPSLSVYEHPTVLEDFLSHYEPFQYVTDLTSLLEWNKKHADIAMPQRESCLKVIL